MVEVPSDTPPTTPVVLTVATSGTLELHTPPGVAFVSVVTLPTHTLTGVNGLIGVGAALTVTGTVAKQAPIL
jgi:hypothetical protein